MTSTPTAFCNVTAQDKASGKKQEIAIQATTNLTARDIDRMVHEAEQHASEDQSRRELIEARNMADQVTYQTEKNLENLAGSVPAEVREQVEAKLSSLKEAAKGEDLQRIRQLINEVQQASLAVGEAAHGGSTVRSGTWPERRTRPRYR